MTAATRGVLARGCRPVLPPLPLLLTVPFLIPTQQQQQQAEQAGADAGSEDEEQQEQLLLLPLGQLPHLQQLDVALCDHREPGVVPMDSWVREGLAELQGLTSLRYDLLPPRVMVSNRPRDGFPHVS